MFSVKAPPIVHSYPINYSRAWFVFSQYDTLMLPVQGSSQPAEVLPIRLDADTMMPQPPALPLLPSGGYAVSDWCGRTLADTPSAQDCAAGVEIAAICSNSASNFDMYEDQSNSQPSPQGPGTLFDASHRQPTGIFLHLSTRAGNQSLVFGIVRRKKKKVSFKTRRGWVFPEDVKIYEHNLVSREREVRFD